MPDYIVPIIAAGIALVAVGWYCRRWGHADGRAEGYEDGRTKGMREGAGVVIPSLASGGPRERA